MWHFQRQGILHSVYTFVPPFISAEQKCLLEIIRYDKFACAINDLLFQPLCQSLPFHIRCNSPANIAPPPHTHTRARKLSPLVVSGVCFRYLLTFEIERFIQLSNWKMVHKQTTHLNDSQHQLNSPGTSKFECEMVNIKNWTIFFGGEKKLNCLFETTTAKI